VLHSKATRQRYVQFSIC